MEEIERCKDGFGTLRSRRCELSEVMPEGACVQTMLSMEMFL